MIIVSDLLEAPDSLKREISSVLEETIMESLERRDFEECEGTCLALVVAFKPAPPRSVRLKVGTEIGKADLSGMAVVAVLLERGAEDLERELDSMSVICCYAEQAKRAAEILKAWFASYCFLLEVCKTFEDRASLRRRLRGELLRHWERLKKPRDDLNALRKT